MLLVALLAGCGLFRRDIQDESLLERCGDAMTEAFPGGDIKVTHAERVASPTASIATMIVAVEGERPKVPPGGPVRREVAVECRFDDNILTGFRWTAGPVR